MRKPSRALTVGVIQWLGVGVAALYTYLLTLDAMSQWEWFVFAKGAIAHIGVGLTALALHVKNGGKTHVITPLPADIDDEPLYPVITPEPAKSFNWTFSQRSNERLAQAHVDLQRVFRRGLALSSLDFSIIETARTAERQAKLKAEGKSQTLDSRHVEVPAMAVDHVPLVDGKACWDWWAFEITTDAIKRAANDLGIDCDFGIDWRGFPDGAHVELSRNVYPKLDIQIS